MKDVQDGMRGKCGRAGYRSGRDVPLRCFTLRAQVTRMDISSPASASRSVTFSGLTEPESRRSSSQYVVSSNLLNATLDFADELGVRPAPPRLPPVRSDRCAGPDYLAADGPCGQRSRQPVAEIDDTQRELPRPLAEVSRGRIGLPFRRFRIHPSAFIPS